jgi:hypothetical protein
MAARMRTSRAALNRLLDPTNPSVTLQTLQKAAQVIGKRLRLELVDARVVKLLSPIGRVTTPAGYRGRLRRSTSRPGS